MERRHHRYGVRRACGSSSDRGAASRTLGRTAFAPPQVDIIPGNRFILLPFKKVSVLVRHHGYPICRGASATSIKTSIQSTNRASNNNTTTHTSSSSSSRPRHRRRRRHRHLAAVTKTSHLGTISEQDDETITKPLLDDPGNGPWKQETGHGARIRKQNQERTENARRINTHLYFRKAGRVAPQDRGGASSNTTTSIFTLDVQPLIKKRGDPIVSKTRLSAEREFVSELVETALKHGEEEDEAMASNGKKRVFGRNRVSPSPPGDLAFSIVSDTSSVQARRAMWRSTFLCSLTDDASDLPIAPLHRRTLSKSSSSEGHN